MIKIRLSEEDRVALGAPEVLEIDPGRFRLREVRLLETAGFTVDSLAEGLQDRRLYALAALCWIGLQRAGVQAPPWEDFDLDLSGIEVEVDDPNPPAPDGAESTPN